MLGSGLPEVLHQVVGADEVSAVAILDGPQRQGDGQVGLAHAGRSQQQDVGGFGDEGQVGQFLDQPLVDGGLEGEVELLEGTLKGQMGQPSTSGEVAFPTGGYLHAEQFGQHLG